MPSKKSVKVSFITPGMEKMRKKEEEKKIWAKIKPTKSPFGIQISKLCSDISNNIFLIYARSVNTC